ncbi:hypothetical protein [Pseudidiomarina halophila]|uniref:hypothetical protein n=1 Tax=Pseudidiomarina halophila TaxID=1449799 RepID=UPI003619DDF2
MPLSTTGNPAKPLAVSIGEPAGIGPEIICKAWHSREEEKLPPFFVLGSTAILEKLSPTTPVQEIQAPEDCADLFDQALPVLDIPCAAEAVPGSPSQATAAMVIQALDQAVKLSLKIKLPDW